MNEPMQQNPVEHPDLERYLDGLLEGTALADFEAELTRNHVLRTAVTRIQEEDSALAASLRRTLAFSDPTKVDHILSYTIKPNSIADERQTAPQTPEASVIAGRLSWGRKFAVAAVLILGLSGIWMIFDYLNPPNISDPYDPGPHQTFPELFARTEAGNLDYWVCEDERQFLTTFYQQFGHAVKLAPELPKGLTALGLSYVNSITQKTIILCGEFGPDSKPILLVIDRLADDDGTEIAKINTASGLKVHRRTAPPFVFYEISRLDQPYFLDALQSVEMPLEWIPGGGRFQKNESAGENDG